MCNGFGGFYHRSGRVFFTVPNDNGNCSHWDTAEKLPKDIEENDLIPFEIPEWLTKKFRWDITSVPDWADKSACIAKLKEVKPIWVEYMKVEAPAWAEYERVTAPARVECEKVMAPAWAEYKKVDAPAWAEMIAELKQIDGYLE